MTSQKLAYPEIWGGIECTINRVQERYLDQMELGGHYKNPGFIDSVISLGIKKLRFPVLWEKHQPLLSAAPDWSFVADCLHKLKSAQVEPIVGLLHHGSGPEFTNLLQDGFPDLFVAYACAFAAKFPWITYYTPVNEPLTTARFSGLYGFWYPHKKNDVSFIRILLNELKATVLAMKEIKKINPKAKFIQTEDLGKTYSTTLLSYQAAFENERRWLTYDILCGKLNSLHPLWDHFLRLGIEEDTLHFFIENPCPPDIIGVNHYLTSERFLDHRVNQYPIETIGGNGLHGYADVEAVRTHIDQPHGLEFLLREIWDRYQIPLAITEVHLGCTREDQLRWFHQVYETAGKLCKEKVKIIAVTSWALFGSFGWNKLLTHQGMEYEPGAFDISAGYIRPTALARLIKSCAKHLPPSNPVLNQAGWWQLNSRYFDKRIRTADLPVKHAVRPLIIIGNSGTLGKSLSRACTKRNIYHFLLGRSEADICNTGMLTDMVNRYHPWAVINAAGYVNVDGAEENQELCYQQNTTGPEVLAKICHRHHIKLLTFSSDLVFNGAQSHPYIETDETQPLNTYGHSKQLAEIKVLHQCPDALIVRTAAFFGPADKYNFVHLLITALAQQKEFVASAHNIISPTYIPHLVDAALDLLIDAASGIWHLTNKGQLSWFAFAEKIIEHTDLDIKLLQPASGQKRPATQPVYAALGSTRYNLMPALDEAIEAYFANKAHQLNDLKNKIINNEGV